MKDEHTPQTSTLPASAENNGGVAADAMLSPEAIDSSVKRLSAVIDRLELESDLIIKVIEDHSDSIQTVILGQEKLERAVETANRKLDTMKELLTRALSRPAQNAGS